MYPRAILQLRHSRAAHALAAAPAWQRGRAAGVVMVDAYEKVFPERRPAHGAGVALGLQHLAEPLWVRPMSLSLYVRFQRDLVSRVTSVCPRRRSVSCALRSARAAVVRHSDPWPGIRGVVLGPRHPLATPIARRLAAS